MLTGERYKNITKETEGILKGEYGSTPAPVDRELQERVLCGQAAITCRPADNLPAEFESLKSELLELKDEKGLIFGQNIDEDVLTYALFPQPGLKFLANRNNPDAFEPKPELTTSAPTTTATKSVPAGEPELYNVEVDGQLFVVKVSPGGDIQSSTSVAQAAAPVLAAGAMGITAPLAGNVFKILVDPGDVVKSGDVVLILEAMKMETEIRASGAGTIVAVLAKEGASVNAGDTLVTLG